MSATEPQGLINLPNEIIFSSIKPSLDLQGLVALSQVCTRLRALALVNPTEADWQQACYRAGFTRSLIHATRTWREIAAALVFHGKNCLGCAKHFDEQMQINQAATDPIIPFTNVDASPGIQIIDKLRCTDGEWGCDSPVYYYFDKKPVDRSYIGSDEAGRLGIHSGLSKEAHLRRQIVLAGLIPTTELIAKVKLVIDEPEFATNFAYLEDDYLADGYDENDPDTWGIVLKPNHAENASGLSCLDLMDGGANWRKTPGGRTNVLYGGMEMYEAGFDGVKAVHFVYCDGD